MGTIEWSTQRKLTKVKENISIYTVDNHVKKKIIYLYTLYWTYFNHNINWIIHI